jgi:hypothetical protein
MDQIDDALFGGLISAIGSLGKNLFKQEIATITFGMGNKIVSNDQSSIVIVSKDLFIEDKIIYFVFFIQGECNHQLTREIATSIFIETKQSLKHPFDVQADLKSKVNRMLDTRFQGLKIC